MKLAAGSRGEPCASEETLALFASGDLEDAEAGDVRAHLGRCPRCQDVLGEFRATRLWLKASGGRAEALPPSLLAEERLAELQRQLDARLDAQQPLPGAIAGLVRFWEGLRRGRLARAASRAFSILQPVVAVAVSGWLVVGALGALARDATDRDGLDRGDALLPPLTAPEPAALEEDGASPREESQGLRIELRTGDPNVRIIWFAANEPGAR